MLKLIKNATLATTLALTTAAASPVFAQDEMDTINFGIISTESQQNLKTTWQPFLAAMEQKTGYKVKAFFAPDYAGIIQACALTR